MRFDIAEKLDEAQRRRGKKSEKKKGGKEARTTECDSGVERPTPMEEPSGPPPAKKRRLKLNKPKTQATAAAAKPSLEVSVCIMIRKTCF